MGLHKIYGIENFVIKTQGFFEMTDEQFFLLCLDNKDLRLERNSNLDIVIKPPKRLEVGKISGEIIRQLANWNYEKGLGMVFNSLAGFILPDKSIWSPYAAWLLSDKFNSLPDEEKNKFPHVCPDFIVEVMSPSDTLKMLRSKMLDWIKHGCRMALLICPDEEIAEVFHQDYSVEEIHGFNKTIPGGNVLPGFLLDLALIKKKR